MDNPLIGRTIVGTRNLSPEELYNLGWYRSTEVLILDNGQELVASKDDEGNDSGVIWLCEVGELLEDE